MSTTTKNLSLLKPELTDVADITAMNENWDKIDEKLHKAYSNENKPSLAEIGAAVASEHNLKTYTNLSQLGLSDGATLSQVARKLPNGSNIKIYVITTSNANLAPNATNGWFEAYKPSVNHVVFQYTTTSRMVYYAVVLNVNNDNEQVSEWTQIANISDLAAYLPLSGGVMTGQGFYLNNKTSRIVGNQNGLWLRTASSDVDNNEDSRHLKLWNSTYIAELARALYLFDTKTNKDYAIYGEHNPKAGASYQTPSTSLLRNSKLVSTETNPTVNGEICWTYK